MATVAKREYSLEKRDVWGHAVDDKDSTLISSNFEKMERAQRRREGTHKLAMKSLFVCPINNNIIINNKEMSSDESSRLPLSRWKSMSSD